MIFEMDNKQVVDDVHKKNYNNSLKREYYIIYIIIRSCIAKLQSCHNFHVVFTILCYDPNCISNILINESPWFCLRRKNNIIYASNKSHHKLVLDVEFTLDWECFNISIKDRQRHGKRIYCASQFELFKITCRQMQHAIFPWIKTLI